MRLALSSLLYVSVLFAGMLALAEAGRRIALWRAARDPDGAWEGIGIVDGAVFGLLGLVTAFAFAGGVSRLDMRRNLFVDEVNAIGGAYLRIDLLPADSQPALRESFRRYVDSRIAVYRDFEDLAAVDAALEANAKLQSEIWTQATAATARSDSAKILMVPALGQMLDVAASRTAATNNHPPPIVYVMLFSLALIGALLAGYGTARAKSRDWLHMLAFAAVTSLTFYVIVDIEYPRLGLIRVSGADRALVALRESMN